MVEPCEFIFKNFTDDLGPQKVIHIYEPRIGLKAIVCVHNVARGPAIGGVRMAPDVTTTEVFRLAAAMTFKNAAADLPHGGGKSGIVADPKMPAAKKEELIRVFGRAIKSLTEYIPGPDMGTDENDMAFLYDEIGRVVGLPRVMGGIPLDEIGATGWGVAECTEVAAPYVNLDLKGATVAIEGYGNVGKPAARFLADKGCVIVAASDTSGTIYNGDGLDVNELTRTKNETGSVLKYKSGKKMSMDELFNLECDILVPAARPDCITVENVNSIRTKLIVPGANIPVTSDAQKVLHKRGILYVPDFIANAGGVTCGAVEYRGGTEDQVFPIISTKIRRNSKEVLDRVYGKQKMLPMDAAQALARERILGAMRYRKC